MSYDVREGFEIKMDLIGNQALFGSENATGFVNIKFLLDGPYKVYKEQPTYTLSAALTDLGGTIGLYLGLSIWSLFTIALDIFVSK